MPTGHTWVGSVCPAANTCGDALEAKVVTVVGAEVVENIFGGTSEIRATTLCFYENAAVASFTDPIEEAETHC